MLHRQGRRKYTEIKDIQNSVLGEYSYTAFISAGGRQKELLAKGMVGHRQFNGLADLWFETILSTC